MHENNYRVDQLMKTPKNSIQGSIDELADAILDCIKAFAKSLGVEYIISKLNNFLTTSKRKSIKCKPVQLKKILPLCNWHIKNILYYLECRFWKRYTVVKSRYLPYTWVDKRELIAHNSFELLSLFIEEECSPGHIEWHGEYGHKIMVNGRNRYVQDVIQELYVWWNKIYNGYYRQIDNELENLIDKHSPSLFECFHPTENENGYLEWDTELAFKNHPTLTKKDKIFSNHLLDSSSILKQFIEQELQEKLMILIKIRPYMWT